VLGTSLVVAADAHLGTEPSDATDAFLSFLERVPDLGDALLLNGDIFDFWFCWRHVMPRHGFRVAAALAQLGRRVPIAMVGGNHDRWGDDFWHAELGARWSPEELRFQVAGRDALAVHGDALTDTRPASRALNRVLRAPLTTRVFSRLHPDTAFGLVRRLDPMLGDDEEHDPAKLRASADRQRAWAEARLDAEPGLGLLLMAHTHQPALVQRPDGRTYLNPGAWFDGYRYAVVTAAGAELRRFTP
jgi:UDP-2,3-diacylglucosamine hydrolase